MASNNIFYKDPSDILDYQVDWATWLGTTGDTIVTSTWTAATGITVASSSNTTTTATAWLSGGTAGTQYSVTNKIVTAARTAEKTIYIIVEQR